MATPFTTTCGISVSNNYDTVGTLTRASLKVLTPTELAALFKTGSTWHEMTALLKTQFEMKACGIRRYGFYDWLMSSNKPGMGKLINIVRRDRGDSLIQPFIMGRQMSVVNIDHWAITNGWANNAYTGETTGPLTAAQQALGAATDRIIRVVTRYGIDLDAKYFLAKHTVLILDVYGGASAVGEWRVLASAAASDASYVDVLVTSQNAGSATNYNPAPTANAIVLNGINNVNDYEKWCQNSANYNPVKHVPFWYQTRRRARQIDEHYKELFAKLMEDNSYFAEFADVPAAERNRQDELLWQKQFVHSFLFGKPISANQTLTGWGSLEQITSVSGATVDPGTGGKLIAYRANMIGVYEQLKACSQVKDLQNQTLNMTEFVDALYNVYRARKSRGKNVTEIDVYTDRVTADLVEMGAINLTKAKYGDIIRINIEPGSNEWGFSWKKLRCPEVPFAINVITEETFDDLQTAFYTEDSGDGALAARGRFLMVLDIGNGGSIYPAVLGSNRRVWKTGEIGDLAKLDSTFACVMENPTIETTLTSETVTAIAECPTNSLWIEGIRLQTPVTTGKTTPYTDLY